MKRKYNWINGEVEIDFKLPVFLQKKVNELERLDYEMNDYYFDACEYLECDDDFCLSTKKEILKEDLNKAINNYLGKETKTFEFSDNFKDEDEMRLYQTNDKVILTFKEFSYQSYKHDFIDVLVNEDSIRVILALSELKENNYTYIGYKNIYLKYKDKRFIIDSIETKLN